MDRGNFKERLQAMGLNIETEIEPMGYLEYK